MHIVHVFIHVKPEYVEAFKEATLDNAQNSIQEPGVARFDFLESQEDPNRFMLLEVYRQVSDAGKHKETDHYQRWRDRVAEMMAEPRTAQKYDNIFPEDRGW